MSEEITNVEEISKRGRKPKGSARQFDPSKFVLEYKKFQDENGAIKEKPVMLREYSSHQGKCTYKTCEFFDVNEESVNEFLALLANKKVDGFFIRDIVGRLGWKGYQQQSRAQVAEKYGQSIQEVEVATNIVKSLIKEPDYGAAYKKYYDLAYSETELSEARKFKSEYAGV